MAEEVKIVDVAGGPAAEATLQEILKVLKGGGGGTGGSGSGAAAAAKAQDLYTTSVTRAIPVRKGNTKALKDATSATETFSSALSSVGGLIGSAFGAIVGVTKNFTQALTSATTIGEVFEAVPVFGSVLSSATSYFQNGIDTFRQLSESGASFGNDMMAMRSAAAQAGLSLDMFAEMVGNNSGTMGYLGGTTSDGAVRMGKLTKALRSQEMGLMSLGYTQQSLNEGMAEYLEQQAMAGQLRGRSDASLIAGAQTYLTELDKLSRVTGKSRKELQDAMRTNAESANIAVMRSRLSGEALTNFDANLAHLTTMVPGLGDAFKDLSDGVAQSPFARVLESSVPGFKALAEANAAGELTQEEFQTRMRELMPEIQSFVGSMDPARIQQLMGREGFDGLMDVFSDAQTYTQRMTDAQDAAAAQARRAPLTDLFANFEQTIQSIRSTFEDAFIDSGVLTFIGEELGKGGKNLLSGFQTIADNLKEYLASPQFKKDFDMVKTKIGEFKDRIMSFIDDIKEFGFMEALSKLFSDAGSDDGSFGDMVSDWIKGAIGSLLPDWDTIVIGLVGGVAALIFAPFLGAFGAIGAAIVAMFGWETIKGWAEDAWNGITGMFDSIEKWWDELDFMKPLNDAWETIKGFFSFGEDDSTFSISQLATDAWETVKGWFTFGEGESSFSISQIASDAWETVKGWFTFGEDSNFSISQIASEAWETVKGWFTFGEGEGFSISQLGTEAWETVKGWFTFGEDSNFSISGIATEAWETVKGWFSFEGVEMPSIKDAFNDIKEKVLGFFDFDFEMPDFTDYLPKWLGGEGKSLFGGDEPGTTATASVSNPEQQEAMPSIENPDNVQRLSTLDYGYQLEQAKLLKAELADISAMQTFNTELERMQTGLDNTAIEAYNTSMQKLVETLEELNEVLAEDNKGMFGGGTGVSAGSMMASGQLGGGSGSGGTEQLDRLNMLVSQLITLQTEGNRYTKGTMKAVNGNLQVGV